MSEIYASADLHLGHSGIIEYCHRPFDSAEEMDEALITYWNETVGPKDIVHLLGDVSFHRDARVTVRKVRALNGHVHLIRGNHDAKLSHWVLDLFDSVHDLREIKVDKRRVTLCHYALRTWNGAHHGAWSLYGHSHGSLEDLPGLLSMDVGVDPNGYRPVSWEQICEHMGAKQFVAIDHHRES